MPETKISKQQIEVYMNKRKEGNTQNISAAKAGFSERSARNVENRNFQVTDKPRDWRTREDKFANVWDAELVPMLNEDPGLQAIIVIPESWHNPFFY
jgi:pectate lyase